MQIDIDDLVSRIPEHRFWLNYLQSSLVLNSGVGIHLAVFSEPFLSRVLNGQKTIESRFSKNRCAPFGEIVAGDIILLKQVAGPIRGITLAKKTWFYDLSHEPIDSIKGVHGELIYADDAFWDGKQDAAFATLIELSESTIIEPVPFPKRDRRGWVTLRPRQLAFAF